MTRTLKNFLKAKKGYCGRQECQCLTISAWRDYQAHPEFCGCNGEGGNNNGNNSNSYPTPEEFKKPGRFGALDEGTFEELNTFSNAYVNYITSGKVLTIEKSMGSFPNVPFYIPNVPDIDLEGDWDNSLSIISSEYDCLFVIEKEPFDAGEPALLGCLGFEPEMYVYHADENGGFYADPVKINGKTVYVVKEGNGYKFELR